MDFLSSFLAFIKQEKLFSTDDHLLIAVSGGLDSTALCELCHLAGFRFSMAHANFQLRGEESERDEQFVRQLAVKYGVELFTKRFDTQDYVRTHKVSVQVAARELRYTWFREIASERAMSILTAHHLDDNIETLLMHFFKGTGMAGLRGMLPRQDGILRPLLFADREQVKQFAQAHQLAWVEDSSNLSDKYSRNFLRHRLIPVIEEIIPGALANLGGNLNRFREIEQLYRQAVERHRQELVERSGEELFIPILKLKKSVPLVSILYEIIHPLGFSARQVGEVLGLLDSGSGKYVCSASHRILKDRRWLIISPLSPPFTDRILIASAEDKIRFDAQELVLQFIPPRGFDPSLAANHIAFLDAHTIHFPLMLRKWRAGDYFYPLGMRKKKKLGRFFIDQKMSLAQKEKTWVIEMDKKIVWVVGLRIDDRFRVAPSTQKILKIETRMS